MKPYNDTLARVFELDNPAKAVDELKGAYEKAILLLIFNSPNLEERALKVANRAARPLGAVLGENEPLKQVILIQAPEVLAAVEADLKARLPEGTDFAQTVAMSLVRGTGAVAHVITQGSLTGSNMGTAFNLALIELGNSNPA
ncbi:MAG: hypothetical protein AAF399_24570 [Bacteroidota bacterium]